MWKNLQITGGGWNTPFQPPPVSNSAISLKKFDLGVVVYSFMVQNTSKSPKNALEELSGGSSNVEFFLE